jgi:hypothetical protein
LIADLGEGGEAMFSAHVDFGEDFDLCSMLVTAEPSTTL